MSSVYDWFAGLATLGGFAYFVLGYAAAYLFHCAREKLRDRPVSIPWHIVGMTIGTVAIVIVTFQASAAYNQAAKTADELKACSREFHQALIAWRRIGSENDEVSQAQRFAIYLWLHDIITPPPPYNQMEPGDPRRQQWGIARTVAVDRALRASFEDQDKLQAERDAHPLPDPLCGR